MVGMVEKSQTSQRLFSWFVFSDCPERTDWVVHVRYPQSIPIHPLVVSMCFPPWNFGMSEKKTWQGSYEHAKCLWRDLVDRLDPELKISPDKHPWNKQGDKTTSGFLTCLFKLERQLVEDQLFPLYRVFVGLYFCWLELLVFQADCWWDT